MLVSDNSGESFRPVKLDKSAPASAVACQGKDNAVIAGAQGVRAQAIQ